VVAPHHQDLPIPEPAAAYACEGSA
jgi:hypothetical protein